MAIFRVTVDGLNVRSMPASTGNDPIAVMPRGTEYERGALSSDGKWGQIQVSLSGHVITGWASSSPNNSEPVLQGHALPAGLSDTRFSVDRRRKYVESILKDPEKFNFLKPGHSAWNDGVWLHSFDDAQGTSRVGANWAAVQKGNLTIVAPTHPGSTFSSPRDTFCNFNVSFCYHQAYGGPCLQFLHNREHSANDMVDMLTHDWKNVSAGQAARIANAGGFVIAAKKAQPHGHVVFLLENSDEGGNATGIKTFHVGGGPPRERTVADIWGSDALVHYVVPPDTFAEFEAAGG
jgi:hypothetical protein